MVPQGGRTCRPSSIQTVAIVSEGDAMVSKVRARLFPASLRVSWYPEPSWSPPFLLLSNIVRSKL